MLLNECIDFLAIVHVIVNLNRMAVMTKINVGPLACVISMDVEDPRAPLCHTLEGLLANLANKTRSNGRRPINGKGLLGEAIKFHILHERCPIKALQVIAMWILALKMANANRRVKSEVEIVACFGGQSLGLDMIVIALVHSIHGSGLGVDC